MTSIWNFTSPLPCPEVGVRFVIQLADVEAVQAHSGWAVTATASAPPFPSIWVAEAATVTPHFAGDGLVVRAADPPQVADAAHKTARSTGQAAAPRGDDTAGGNRAQESIERSLVPTSKNRTIT